MKERLNKKEKKIIISTQVGRRHKANHQEVRIDNKAIPIGVSECAHHHPAR
jgi:hypothetical protein